MKNIYLKGMVSCLVFALVLVMFTTGFIQAAPETKEKKVNINTASVSELQALPRIGVKVAERIVAFRKEHGKFKKIEEIMKVKGIGEKIFKQIKDKITVD